MAQPQFPRIERLLGGPLEDARYEQIAALVNKPSAHEDLNVDYKGFLYADPQATKKSHRPLQPDWKDELAKDVCGMANKDGGVIILGLHEDSATSVPSAVNVRPWRDADRREYEETVAERIDPPLDIGVHFAQSPDDPAVGFVVIVVPRSLRGPHSAQGVGGNMNAGYMRFPVRRGSGTNFLTAAEAFAAWERNRASLGARRSDHNTLVHELLREGILAEQSWPRLVISLNPEVAGEMELRTRSRDAFTQELVTEPLWLAEHGHTFDAVTPCPLGLDAQMYSEADRNVRAILGRDGTGAIDYQLRALKNTIVAWPGEVTARTTLSPGELCGMVLSALGLLARHAVHRAGARGACEVQVQVLSTAAAMPNIPPSASVVAPYIEPIALGGSGSVKHAVATAETSLESLTIPGAELVKVADKLLTTIAHAFGESESLYTTATGALVRDKRTPFFPSGPLYEWAKRNGVEVVDWQAAR
ncbi:helix-turn-helix domain-containing protein [Kitasatospora purpeofusca]|uniref:AlbA family DNA-binding domain-containing protein n=1 Tax=Kitasatospora purpeofusca TaxID=67352 RepID=UPI0035D742A4